MHLFSLFIFLEINTWQINKAHLSTHSFYFVFMFIECSKLKQENIYWVFFEINKTLKQKRMWLSILPNVPESHYGRDVVAH